MGGTNVASDGRTMTDGAHAEISIKQRGGRNLVLAPNGTNATAAPVTRHVDNVVVKVIARAFRWRDLLESSEYATIREIAVAEKSTRPKSVAWRG